VATELPTITIGDEFYTDLMATFDGQWSPQAPPGDGYLHTAEEAFQYWLKETVKAKIQSGRQQELWNDYNANMETMNQAMTTFPGV
jgi:hypothetical protein